MLLSVFLHQLKPELEVKVREAKINQLKEDKQAFGLYTGI